MKDEEGGIRQNEGIGEMGRARGTKRKRSEEKRRSERGARRGKDVPVCGVCIALYVLDLEGSHWI